MDGTKTNSTEIDLTYFDDQLLSYYITTDRDGMAERAKERWYQRWHLAYPYRKRAIGIENFMTGEVMERVK